MSLQVPVDNGSFKGPHTALQVKHQTALVGPPPYIPRPIEPVLFGSKSGSELFEARSICRLDKTFLSSTEKATPNIRRWLRENTFTDWKKAPNLAHILF